MIKKNSSAKWIGEDRYFFIPFWIPLASTLGVKLARSKKRRHDEGEGNVQWTFPIASAEKQPPAVAFCQKQKPADSNTAQSERPRVYS